MFQWSKTSSIKLFFTSYLSIADELGQNIPCAVGNLGGKFAFQDSELLSMLSLSCSSI